MYYKNNVAGSITFLEEMLKAKVDTFVSSSATLYAELGVAQYLEDMPTTPINVYGRTKLRVEEISGIAQKPILTYKWPICATLIP